MLLEEVALAVLLAVLYALTLRDAIKTRKITPIVSTCESIAATIVLAVVILWFCS